jgi:hypothetical protein
LGGKGGQERGISVIESPRCSLPYDQYALHLAPMGDRYTEKAVEAPGSGLLNESLIQLFGHMIQVYGLCALGYPPNEPLAEAELNVTHDGRRKTIGSHDHMPLSFVLSEVDGADICCHYFTGTLYHDTQRRLHVWC